MDINIPFDDRSHGNEITSSSFLSKKRAPNLVMTEMKTLGFFMNVSERNTRSVEIGILEREDQQTAIEMGTEIAAKAATFWMPEY